LGAGRLSYDQQIVLPVNVAELSFISVEAIRWLSWGADGLLNCDVLAAS
jgi:hypothetical protein